MARFFAFFMLFHLSLTFFRPEVPFKYQEGCRLPFLNIPEVFSFKHLKNDRKHGTSDCSVLGKIIIRIDKICHVISWTSRSR